MLFSDLRRLNQINSSYEFGLQYILKRSSTHEKKLFGKLLGSVASTLFEVLRVAEEVETFLKHEFVTEMIWKLERFEFAGLEYLTCFNFLWFRTP